MLEMQKSCQCPETLLAVFTKSPNQVFFFRFLLPNQAAIQKEIIGSIKLLKNKDNVSDDTLKDLIFLKKNRLWWTSLLVASTWGSKHSSAAKLLLIHQSHTHRDLYLIKMFIMTESRQEVLGASHPAVRLLCRSKTVKQFDFLCLSWMLLMNNNLLINEIIWIQNSLSVTHFVCLLLVYLYSSNTLRRLCTFHMRAGTWH